MHVDPVLKKDGTSWAELFGTEGAAVTVGLMLQMRSGIKDYDGNQFDDLLLYNQSSAMTSPVAFIKCVNHITCHINHYNIASAMTSPVAFIKCVQRVPGEYQERMRVCVAVCYISHRIHQVRTESTRRVPGEDACVCVAVC